MFAASSSTKSTLLCGPPELTRSLLFEAAIHWAEEGHRVIYIATAQIQSLPATYHDRPNLSPAAFKLMRFMYLPTYEILVEQLVTLHTFAVLPSVLLIDDMDTYARDSATKQQSEIGIARLCAIVQDSINACSRILKRPVHLCVSTSTRDTAKTPYPMYFSEIWHLRIVGEDEGGRNIELSSEEREDDPDGCTRKVYKYRSLADRTLILKEISEKFVSHS